MKLQYSSSFSNQLNCAMCLEHMPFFTFLLVRVDLTIQLFVDMLIAYKFSIFADPGEFIIGPKSVHIGSGQARRGV